MSVDFQRRLLTKLANKYGIDKRIVKEVVYSPLKFTRDIISDDVDERPIRIRYFGAFIQKKNSNKSSRMNTMFEVLYNNIEDTFIVMVSLLGFQLKNKDSARKTLETARDQKDYDKIKMIYDAYKEYTK